MSKRTNILLGGQGLIGTALNRKLVEIGERTVVYDLKSGFDLRLKEPDWFPGDQYYWFLAWDVGGAKYIMDELEQVSILRSNLALCEKVFGWLEKRKARFTFVSTQMVGYPNAYGVTKSVGEIWTKAIGNGLIVRLWNCYGAEEPSKRSHVIPDLIQQGQQGVIRLMTSGSERRQFLYVDDCAEALIRQRELQQPLADVTSGKWVSIREISENIGFNMGAEVVPGEKPGYESLISPKVPLKGWQPSIDLETGIKMVIQTMKNNGWL
jgi:nucleoside-diphosphate-sugar epimerase